MNKIKLWLREWLGINDVMRDMSLCRGDIQEMKWAESTAISKLVEEEHKMVKARFMSAASIDGQAKRIDKLYELANKNGWIYTSDSQRMGWFKVCKK